MKGCLIGASVILISLLSMYLALSGYYRGGFSYGTWINGIYCTGKSVNEANEELLSQCSYEGLAVHMGDGRFFTILPTEVDCTITFREPLTEFLENQNPYLWVDNLIGEGGQKELLPQVSYDEKLFEDKLKSFGITRRPRSKDRVEIQKGDEGYFLVNERQDVFDEAPLRQSLTCGKRGVITICLSQRRWRIL